MHPLFILSVIGFTILTSLILGLLVLFRNPQNKINIIFFIVNIFLILWAGCLLFYEFPIIFSSTFWIKATYFVSAFLLSSILIFSFIFPKIIFRRIWWLAGIFITFFLCFSYWILFCTNFWIIGTIIDPIRGLQTLIGPGYIWWLFLAWGAMIGALVNFIFHSRRASRLGKMQLRYIFCGFGIWAVLLNIPDIIMPIFWQETKYFSISPASNLVFTLAVAYSILKHRLMDIRLVIARTVSYALLLITLASFYVFSLFSLSSLFYGVKVNGTQVFINAFLALIIAFTFQPLRRFLEKVTDKIFFKERYDTESLLSELSKILSSTLILKDIINNVLRKLLTEINIDNGAIVLLEKERIKIFYKNGEKPKQINKQEIDVLLKTVNQPIIFDELPEGARKKSLRINNFYFSYTLKVKEKTLGLLLLGEKLSGDIYSNQDIDFLEILVSSWAVAIENALAYQKIQKFSNTLKIKVEEATMALRKTNKRLKEVSALKDEFVYLASHELRTPLTAISGSLSTVSDGYAGKVNKKAKEFIEGAYNENQRLIRLVNNLLNISRIEGGRLKFEIKKFDLSAIVQTVVESLKTQAEEKKIDLIFNAGKDLMVNADEDKIREILVNLIGNAIKFTDEGRVAVTAWKQSKIIIVGIEDTGRGILPEDQPKLFRKFEKLDYAKTGRKKGGTGLGLYICKNLIDGMGGEIWIESEHRKGSTFFFIFPLLTV